MVTVEGIVHELGKLLEAPNRHALKAAVEVFQRRVDAIDPSTTSKEVLEVIDDLAFDLAAYEPDDHCRDDPSLLDEARARSEIEQARDRLASSRGGTPRRAASFGGDPSIGDGLTEMQRRPPPYTVDRDGTVRPAPEDTAP